jgi:hypothetical protein
VVRRLTGKGANRFCFLEREVAKRKWRKTEAVVFSGLFFFGSFLLEEQKKGTLNFEVLSFILSGSKILYPSHLRT